MKKFLLFFMTCCLAFFCTGCVKYSYNYEIDKKDKVTLNETEAFNTALFQSIDPMFNEKWQNTYNSTASEYKEKGYEVKEYNKDGYIGITVAKKDIDLMDLSKNITKEFVKDLQQPVSIEKGFLKSTYKIHLYYNLQDVRNNIAAMNNVLNSEQGFPAPVMELTIKIPYKAVRHNASKVLDNNTYYWNLVSEQPVDIVLEYEKYDFSALAMIISLVGVLLLLLWGFNKSKEDIGF